MIPDEESGYWIGHPGALLPLPDIQGSLTRASSRTAVIKESAGGRRRAFLSPRRESLREWRVSIPDLYPDQIARLHDLLTFTDPPYVWVDPWSRVTNLLSPRAAGMQSAIPADLPRLGRQELADGGWAAVAVANPTGGAVRIEPAPVVPDQPVTVSAYVASEDPVGASVRLQFRDSAGMTTGDLTVSPVSVFGSETLGRGSVAGVLPPPDAVSVEIVIVRASVIANPAVTWTEAPTEYGPPGGVAQVIVSEMSEDVQTAYLTSRRGDRVAGLSFTVTELG